LQLYCCGVGGFRFLPFLLNSFIHSDTGSSVDMFSSHMFDKVVIEAGHLAAVERTLSALHHSRVVRGPARLSGLWPAQYVSLAQLFTGRARD